MVLRELSQGEFNDFVNQYPLKSLYQSVAYAKTMQKQQFDVIYVGLIDNDIKAASLILIQKLSGFKYAYAPKGFLIDYTNYELLNTFTKLLKNYLSKKKVIAIKISPLITRRAYLETVQNNPDYELCFYNLTQLGYEHLGYNNFFEAMKPRFEAIVDLNKTNYALFNSLRKETKTKIRSGIKDGITIYRGNRNDLNYLYLQTQKKYPRDLQYFDALYEAFNENKQIAFYFAKLDTNKYMAQVQKEYVASEIATNKINELVTANAIKKKKNTHVVSYKLNIDKAYDKAKKDLVEATKLIKDYPDGIVLASALCITNQPEVYLIMDGFNPQYKHFNAKHLLIYKLMDQYLKAGYTKFNLGGCTNPTIMNNPYDGLNVFKKNMGGQVYEYAGDFELITNKPLYLIYRNMVPLRSILKK